MQHYIIIDAYSGFICGDHRTDKPEDLATIEACRAIDEEAGNDDRTYERVSYLDGDSGYHVYDATDLNLEIYDGQDQAAIDLVTSKARPVGCVQYTISPDLGPYDGGAA